MHLTVFLRRALWLELPDDSSDVKSPGVTFLDGLSVFRKPIQFRFNVDSFDDDSIDEAVEVKNLFEQCSDVRGLLADKKITVDFAYQLSTPEATKQRDQ